MRVFLVSHTHWDREWYRSFQTFRARLVDTVDRVLDLIAADPGFCFVLDGQSIVLEDYLEIRPERRDELTAACRSGRLGIGPWYVQPDSLLPSGEAHVRNLLIGRALGAAVGPLSRVAYTPDSFGHPAQFPQIFAGFDLGPFVYWRGNGDEIDGLPAEYLWEAPDGSTVAAHHLWKGYFSAALLPADAQAASAWLADVVKELAARTRSDCVLLLNGIDHAPPDANTAAVAAALAARSGATVQRALLDDFAAALPVPAARFRGELVGARVAHLLPGVWSTRMPLKLRNRRVETLLEAWAEPWSALGERFGLRSERPALQRAWCSLLQNQAHDSICGCSLDRVHEQMTARYDAAEDLADETTRRVLERLSGLETTRATPWGDLGDGGAGVAVAVFNPSPHRRSDLVRLALDPQPWMATRDGADGRELAIHPLLVSGLTAPGFSVDGQPVRMLADNDDRVRLLPEHPAWTIEFVARDVPAFGWRRFTLRVDAATAAVEDHEREIRAGSTVVTAAGDGTFTVCFGAQRFEGLCGIEDRGDRGDSYDFDPVDAGGTWSVDSVNVTRHLDANGVQRLHVERRLNVPAGLAADREQRSDMRVDLVIETEARLIPSLARVDVSVRVHNSARDHRLRLLFPTGAGADEFLAATTFDVMRRSTAPRAATGWIHPPPATFPQQGFVMANGLTVAAAGLPEAEVSGDGVIAITLLRAVGWLSRMDLHSRVEPAGPLISTPGAQALGTMEATLALLPGCDARAVRDAEVGLRAMFAGERPLLAPEQPLLEVEPREVLVTTCKPAAEDGALVLRLLNPTDSAIVARLRFGFALQTVELVRLDETPMQQAIAAADGSCAIAIPPHALRSLRVR